MMIIACVILGLLLLCCICCCVCICRKMRHKSAQPDNGHELIDDQDYSNKKEDADLTAHEGAGEKGIDFNNDTSEGQF